jgi:hypothetical protein
MNVRSAKLYQVIPPMGEKTSLEALLRRTVKAFTNLYEINGLPASFAATSAMRL